METSSSCMAAAAVPAAQIKRVGSWPIRTLSGLEFGKRRIRTGIRCSCSDSELRKLRGGGGSGGKAVGEMAEEMRKSSTRRVRTRAMPSVPFPSRRSGLSKQQGFYPRCSPKNYAPKSRDNPPKRDTGIASEKEWGISLLDESIKESGTNEDGSTWFRESGEDLGKNGYRCRWARMGGQSSDGTSEWMETDKFWSCWFY